MNMHKIFLTWAIFLSLLPTTAFTQGGLLLENNVRMVASGSVNIVIENGKWENASSIYHPGKSTVKFTGASSYQSVIGGSSTTQFYHLEVAKSNNDLKFTSGAGIHGKVYFTSGKINLASHGFTLQSNSVLAGENNNSRTYTTATGFCRGYSLGSLNSPVYYEPYNLGMRITATGNFLGPINIERKHTGFALLTGISLLKNWSFSANSTPPAQNATLRFYYFDADLNGLDESTLSIWKSNDNGVTWVDLGFSSRNTSANYVEKSGINNIIGLWTLGKSIFPFGLPGDDRSEPLYASAIETPWQINPNPVADQARVSIVAEQTETIRLELFDATGKTVLIHRRELMPGENQFALELQNLASGTYYARIVGRNAATIPIVKL